MTGWWTTKRWRLAAACSVTIGSLSSIALSGAPSVYTTGTTIYHPAKTWNGYTVFITPESEGVIVIDMNGRVVKQWTGLSGAAGGPARVLPGGYVIAGTGGGAPHQESPALVQLDWNRSADQHHVDGYDACRPRGPARRPGWQRRGIAAAVAQRPIGAASK